MAKQNRFEVKMRQYSAEGEEIAKAYLRGIVAMIDAAREGILFANPGPAPKRQQLITDAGFEALAQSFALIANGVNHSTPQEVAQARKLRLMAIDALKVGEKAALKKYANEISDQALRLLKQPKRGRTQAQQRARLLQRFLYHASLRTAKPRSISEMGLGELRRTIQAGKKAGHLGLVEAAKSQARERRSARR
jgi:hypothetical protein